MPPSGNVTTLCFHTHDAVRRENGSFTFQIPSQRLRSDASTVALASCEFPMVQWTIEEEWSRLHLSEGLALTSDNNVLPLAVHDGATQSFAHVDVRLPPRLNRIARATRKGPWLVVECTQPHGLSTLQHEPVRRIFQLPGGVLLTGGQGGDVVLCGDAAEEFECLSDTQFRVSARVGGRGDDDATQGMKYVVAPLIPTPDLLCQCLSDAMGKFFYEEHGLRFTLQYDGARDRICMAATADCDANQLVRILPSPLAAMCGLSVMPVRVVAQRAVWPSESTNLWAHADVPPGFYAPCHRPMCTGQPLRLGSQLELVLNRLYFPVRSANDPAHQLIFADAAGRNYACVIPPGRYTPAQLCRHLSEAMTQAVRAESNGGASGGTRPPHVVQFLVTHADDRFFTFACTQQDDVGRSVAVPFGLLFHHPLSLDPERLGFTDQPLGGASSYVAPRSTAVPTAPHGRTLSNIVRVSEIGAQKRFRFHATSVPAMVGLVESGSNAAAQTLVLRTHVNRQPFAHGFQVGDVVRIAASGANGTTLASGSGATGGEREHASARFGAHRGGSVTCVVAAVVADVQLLHLHGPCLPGLYEPGAVVQVVTDPAPFSMSFARPKTIPPALLGFDADAVLWGVHGTVRSGAWALPPYDAPHTHCLDHPDYVLLTFSESAGTSLEHHYGNETRAVWCKLSLYPLFREERMLPRETALMRSSLGTFTVSFWNPDMRTPYQFHGANFSFSLSFL